ncbi:MAG: undecaprenyldiphospho-muramoylpentapeptide beta-N-acetylglucosaminyltransferase [Rhizobacter sp.]|nr:undecaprenyldiphospho-muramoylpentapeptide beta-N-acetylglucosaminyltransferase [Chlorobiales bacterium]
MKFIFAGGGTGGHLYPAMAIATEVLRQRPDAEVQFVGTERGLEASVVPKQGFTLHLISVAGFRRGLSLQAFIDNLKFPFRLMKSLAECRTLIEQEQPDVVIGTGGFVSGPVLYAAQAAGIPTLVQEQNAKPGITTRLVARKADEVHLAFAEAKSFFNRQENLFLTGNPTRDFGEVDTKEAKSFFEMDATRRTVLIFGGSLGARSINTAIEKWIDELLEEVNVIWQTGKSDFESVKSRVGTKKNLWLGAYIDRMDYAYAASDVVICRAGASTLAELTWLGKASVLIPYPFAAANHQFFNAKSLADAGAAVMIEDKDLNLAKEKIFALLKDKTKLENMRRESLKLGQPDATRIIAERAINLAESEVNGKAMQSSSGWTVGYDDEKIWSVSPSGERRELNWPEIKGVFVETNDQGPWADDVWWMVSGEKFSVMFPNGAAGEKEILERLQRLPNFNNEELIKAMTSTDNRLFIIWDKKE